MVEAKAEAVVHKAKVDAAKAKAAEAKAAKAKAEKAKAAMARVESNSMDAAATNLVADVVTKHTTAINARPTYMMGNITRVVRVRMLLQCKRMTTTMSLNRTLLATATLPLVNTLS